MNNNFLKIIEILASQQGFFVLQIWKITNNEGFKFPKEHVNITTLYLKFGDWAFSGRSTFTDWYNNTISGYRNITGIFGF